MSSLPLRLLGLLSVLTLAGCATPPSWWPPVADTGEPETVLDDKADDRDLNALLAYYQSIEGQPERALDRERKSYQAALTDGRCDSERMRLGLVLLRAAESGARIEGSENTMQPCIQDASLVGTNVHYVAQLIDAQLRRNIAEHTRYQRVFQEAEVLKKENQELRRQVEGLKAIERSLQDRQRREQEGTRGTAR